MPYALNLTLDRQTSDTIERIYARLGALDVPDRDLVTQYGPCITVLVVDSKISPSDISQTLLLRLPALTSFAVRFTEPCIILGSPPTLSLRVNPSAALLALHAAFYSEFPEDEVHLHYRPAYWQPHLKLSNVRQNQAAADKLVATLRSGWRERDGVADGLEAIQYPPAQSVWQARLQPEAAGRNG